MIIRVYLFVPRWRPVIGRFLVLWHSFNKFVLAKRLHEPAVFNRNHIYIFFLLNIFLFLLLLFCQRTVGCIQSAILPYVYIYIPTYHICRRVFLFLCLWVGYSCFAFFIGDSWRKVSTGEYRVTYRVWSVNLNLLITHWGRLTLAPPTGDGWGCIFFFFYYSGPRRREANYRRINCATKCLAICGWNLWNADFRHPLPLPLQSDEKLRGRTGGEPYGVGHKSVLVARSSSTQLSFWSANCYLSRGAL